MIRRALRIGLPYAAAAGLIWWLSRGIKPLELARELARADLRLFLPVTAGTFFCWFLGENLLFSRLFGYFFAEIGFLEMLPINAAFYFFQLVNGGLAVGVLAWLVHKRKAIPLLQAGFAMLLISFIDLQVAALMTLAACGLAGGAPSGFDWRWAVWTLVACWLFAWFGKLCEWEPLSCFRKARPSHYAGLLLIRGPIFLIQGVSLYLSLRSFGVRAPLTTVLAINPAIILVKALPITPMGLGSEQAAILVGFSSFGAKESLLAMSLAVSGLGVLFRLGAGLGFACSPGGLRSLLSGPSSRRQT